MNALLLYFVDLARLRRGPQDLPASQALLVLCAVAGLLLGAVNGAQVFGSVAAAFGANVIDLVLTLALLALLLRMRGHAARWTQTTTAFLGLGVLAGLVMLLTRGLSNAVNASDVAMLIDLVVAVWLHVALGHVLRHALDIPLMAGVLIVLAYTMLAFNVIAQIYPLAGVS